MVCSIHHVFPTHHTFPQPIIDYPTCQWLPLFSATGFVPNSVCPSNITALVKLVIQIVKQSGIECERNLSLSNVFSHAPHAHALSMGSFSLSLPLPTHCKQLHRKVLHALTSHFCIASACTSCACEVSNVTGHHAHP